MYMSEKENHFVEKVLELLVCLVVDLASVDVLNITHNV